MPLKNRTLFLLAFRVDDGLVSRDPEVSKMQIKSLKINRNHGRFRHMGTANNKP